MSGIININNISNTYVERSRLYNLYMDDIRKIPLLSKEDEVSLLRQYKNTDSKDEKIKIRNRLLKHNQLFVASAAKVFASNNVDTLLDLISEGNLGLIEAIESYDETKSSVKLISWGSYYVRKYLNRYLLKNRNIVKQPYNDLLYYEYAKARNILVQREGREVTEEEIFEYLSEEKKLPITSSSDVRQLQVNSIDAQIQDDDEFNVIKNEYNSITSTFNESEKNTEKNHVKTMLNIAIDSLDERERGIIRMMYGLNDEMFEKSLNDVAEKFNCTPERIRQLKVNAERKLKHKLSKCFNYS